MIGELVRYRPSAFRRGHRGRPLGLAIGSVVLNGGQETNHRVGFDSAQPGRLGQTIA